MPRFPWQGNDYSSVQGNGIGEGTHTKQNYYALDFGKIDADDTGLPVVAVDNGTAEVLFQPTGCGLYVKVLRTQYSPDLTSVYCHLDAELTADGAAIKLGERVGTVGCSGLCTGAHLHFVLWNNYNCASSSCSVAWDGYVWNINDRTGRPRLSTFRIYPVDSDRSGHWYSDNACMGCYSNYNMDSAIKSRWSSTGEDVYSSHRGVPCAKSVTGCTTASQGYDPNYYYWCNSGATTSTCRWVHGFNLTGCPGLGQAVAHNNGQKGIIVRSTAAGCPTAAKLVANQLFRGYVQWSDYNPSQRVVWLLGFPLGQQYVPPGLPDYRKQDFDNGFMLLIINSTTYEVEAWLNSGPRIFHVEWPKTDFP